MTPSLSIIIPTVGRSSLSRTLESVFSQARFVDQVIVVDDGPIPSVCWPMHMSCGIYHTGTSQTQNHGNAQRQHGMTKAVGDVLLFLTTTTFICPVRSTPCDQPSPNVPVELH